MATEQPQARPPQFAIMLHNITNVFIIALIVGAIYWAWPWIVAQFSTPAPVTAPLAQPTAAVITRPPSGGVVVPPAKPAQPPAVIADPAPAPVEAQPNVVPVVPDAPIIQQRPNEGSAPPPPGMAPTAEPRPADGFGSKQKEPVNVQQEKTCLHGQVWFEGRGCLNPLR